MRWAPGYSLAELRQAQERFGLTFPPDLVALLNERRPANGYDWSRDDSRIRAMLKWPFESLLFDVENGFWWPTWGERPAEGAARAEVLRDSLATAPRLIPLLGHRFLPETPHLAGNPVLSMHGFDTIYYGADLAEYFSNEFGGRHVIGAVRHVPFWSDIVEHFDDAYAYYAAANEDR